MAETLEYLTVCRAPRLRTQFEQAHGREKTLDDDERRLRRLARGGGCDAWLGAGATLPA